MIINFAYAYRLQKPDMGNVGADILKSIVKNKKVDNYERTRTI